MATYELELLTVDDVAAALRLGKTSVYRLMDAGKLTPIRPGGLKSLRFDPLEVRRLVDDSRGLDWRKSENGAAS